MITIRDLMYAAKLRTLRGQKNVKQLYAAGLMGIECQQHYSDFESGKKHFTEDMIKKICEGFKIPISEFKKVNYEMLDEMIHRAELTTELQIYFKKVSNKEHYLYLLECEKRLLEIKLENARKKKELLEVKENPEWIFSADVPMIYVMA